MLLTSVVAYCKLNTTLQVHRHYCTVVSEAAAKRVGLTYPGLYVGVDADADDDVDPSGRHVDRSLSPIMRRLSSAHPGENTDSAWPHETAALCAGAGDGWAKIEDSSQACVRRTIMFKGQKQHSCGVESDHAATQHTRMYPSPSVAPQ